MPLPSVPSPLPFDLRAAKSRRISAESAPGLAPIWLVSQLFDQTRPLGRSARRACRVPSQLTFSAAPCSRALRDASLLHRTSTHRPPSGHRANQASIVPLETEARRSVAPPLGVELSRVMPSLGLGRPCARNLRPRAPKRSPAAGRSSSEGRCLHRKSLRRKRGRTVSQGRLLIVELWASQAPGSHGPQLERTSC